MFFCMMSLPHLPTLCIIAMISAFTYFSIDFAMAPYWSLLPDTTPVDQRATASGVMNLLGGIGVIAYFLVGSRIWDANSTIVFYIVAVVSLGSVLTTVAVVREPELQPLAPTVRTFNPFAYLQSVMRETNVMRFLGAQSLWWLGFWTIQPFLTLFVVERLGATEGTSLFVPMAAGVVSTIVVVPLGMLGDRHSRKRILSCAVAFWVAAEISIGFSQNIMHAVLSVGSIGFPIAAVMAIGYAHMLDLVPAKRTAEFVGLHILSMAAPQIFGPMIGGKLIDTYGYRSMFPTAALFTISALIVLQFVHPRRHIGEESSRAENSFTPA
jgi:MFS-type transporter involved in bile tolerance (Atg22 family)